MQINWTLVAGLAAFSLAAAANWDAGTAAGMGAGDGRGRWRLLTLVYLLLLGEVIVGWRFAVIEAVVRALPGIGRHAVQIAAALLLLLVTAIVAVPIARVGRRTPLFAPAALLALAAVLLFGGEMLSLQVAGALLYRPAGPVMLIAWLWLAGGAAAVAIAIVAVRTAARRRIDG